MTTNAYQLPADVRNRILASIEAAVSAPRPTLAVVREFTRTCAHCGTVLVFTGTDDAWAVHSVTFDDTHDCGVDA